MPQSSEKFFQNRDCPYFPCHAGLDEYKFNCLFCYCPLHPLVNCGGSYELTEAAIKDCSRCVFPHAAQNYAAVLERLSRMLKHRKYPDGWAKI